MRGVRRHVDRGEIEHQVRDHRADARAGDLRDDVHARVARRHAAEDPVGHRHDRVEVRARDRAEREDQRDEARRRWRSSSRAAGARRRRGRGAARRCRSRRRSRRGARCRRTPPSRGAPGRDPRRSSAAARRGLAASAQHIASPDDGRSRSVHLGVGEHRVDLPRLARRARRPTPCPAPRSSRSLRPRWRWRDRRPARRACAAPTSSVDSDLDAEVVQRARLAVALDEHELQRRLGDGEVRVAGPHLGRLGGEQLASRRRSPRRGRDTLSASWTLLMVGLRDTI